MGIFPILSVVFGATALIATGVTPIAILRDRKLSREGVATTGTVVAVEEDNESGYNARVEFSVRGARHSFFAATQRNGLRSGQTVPVRYLPHQPDHAAIDARGRIYAGTIMAIALSVSFWLVTGIMLVLWHELGDR